MSDKTEHKFKRQLSFLLLLFILLNNNMAYPLAIQSLINSKHELPVFTKGEDSSIHARIQEDSKLDIIIGGIKNCFDDNLNEIRYQPKGTRHITVQSYKFKNIDTYFFNKYKDLIHDPKLFFLNFLYEILPKTKRIIESDLGYYELIFDKMVLTDTGVIILICSENPFDKLRKRLIAQYKCENQYNFYPRQHISNITHMILGRFKTDIPRITLDEFLKLKSFIERYNRGKNKFSIQIFPEDFYFIEHKRGGYEVWDEIRLVDVNA